MEEHKLEHFLTKRSSFFTVDQAMPAYCTALWKLKEADYKDKEEYETETETEETSAAKNSQKMNRLF